MADDPPPSTAVPALRPLAERRREPPAAPRYKGQAPHRDLDAGDVASVLGLPPSAVTPAVSKAVTALMDQMEALRFETASHERRQHFLEDLADRDPVLPVLNRRGLLRVLGRLLLHGERSGMPGSFLCIQVGGIDDIRAAHGLAAGDAAALHVVTLLLASVRATDFVGHLDGGLFGVILTVAEGPAARWKAEDLAHRINLPPFVWREREMRLGVSLGVHDFVPGEDAEHVLQAADRDRLERQVRR